VYCKIIIYILFFISSLPCDAAEQQDELVSLLDVRDLLALRLVSSETKSWLDTVMLGHRSKVFTLTLDWYYRTLDRFMDEEKKIPFKTLNFNKTRASSSFYSHPLLPSFLQTYGPQIHRIHTPYGFFLHPNAEYKVEVPPEKELAFYQGIPNLIHLSLFTSTVEENVPLPTIEEEKLPFLRQLQSFSIQLACYSDSDSCEVIRNIDFLRHCPNLRKLTLNEMPLVESVKVLTALGDYFVARNGWKGGIPPTLTIFIQTHIKEYRHDHLEQQRQIEEGMVNKLLEELAASDGRILIQNMPITLLDGAVRLFSKQSQRGKLRNFVKCIISLIGFSDSLYEVELPNMRKLRVDGELIFLGKEREGDGDYTKTVNWPKLEIIELENYLDEYNHEYAPAVPVTEDLSYMKKLVFESGLRATVKRLDYDFRLNFLSWDDEAPHLLRNLPNLTQLLLSVNEEDAESFRSLMQRLPTSSPKLQLLKINTRFPLKDEDFLLGMNGDDTCCVPPFLQLSGNYYQ
jgi:Leucine-rich repeat (LRR) protein